MHWFNSHSHPILGIDIEFKVSIDSAYLFTEQIADLISIEENKSHSSNRKRSLAARIRAECIWLWGHRCQGSPQDRILIKILCVGGLVASEKFIWCLILLRPWQRGPHSWHILPSVSVKPSDKQARAQSITSNNWVTRDAGDTPHLSQDQENKMS